MSASLVKKVAIFQLSYQRKNVSALCDTRYISKGISTKFQGKMLNDKQETSTNKLSFKLFFPFPKRILTQKC